MVSTWGGGEVATGGPGRATKWWPQPPRSWPQPQFVGEEMEVATFLGGHQWHQVATSPWRCHTRSLGTRNGGGLVATSPCLQGEVAQAQPCPGGW